METWKWVTLFFSTDYHRLPPITTDYHRLPPITTDYHHFHVGMALGPVSGLIGIDIDGTEGVRRLEQIIGIIPETLAFTTPGGQDRRRLLVLHPSIEIANRSLRVAGHEAVRIVTKGTQTVMPPSRHASGGRYSWTNQAAPLPFPQLLLDYLLLPEAPSVIAPPPVAPAAPLPGQASPFTRARAYLALCDPAIAGQGGHNQTFKIGCKLVKGFGLDAETALHLLLSDYNPLLEPIGDVCRIKWGGQSSNNADQLVTGMTKGALPGNSRVAILFFIRGVLGTPLYCKVEVVKSKEPTMSQIAMTIPDESLAALAESPELASAELRMLAAVKLFEMKKLSSGAAARLAGISRVEFLLRLGKYGVPIFDMTEEELEQETRLA